MPTSLTHEPYQEAESYSSTPWNCIGGTAHIVQWDPSRICKHADTPYLQFISSRDWADAQRLTDKTEMKHNARWTHMYQLWLSPHVLRSKHTPLTITKRRYKAEMSVVSCVFIIGKYTQLLASNVVSEQCWQLHTSSTRDTLREIVGGTGPLTLQSIPQWVVFVSVKCKMSTCLKKIFEFPKDKQRADI